MQNLLDDFSEELVYLNMDDLILQLESRSPGEITEEEILSLFMSMEFAESMHEEKIQNFLYSDEYLEFFNREDVQNVVNSDEYATFLNSDPCQTFLYNYFNYDEESLASNSQTVSLGAGQVESTISEMISSTNVETSPVSSNNGGFEIGSCELIGSTQEITAEATVENINGEQDPEPTFIIMLTLLAIAVLAVLTVLAGFVCGVALVVVLTVVALAVGIPIALFALGFGVAIAIMYLLFPF